MTAPILPPGAVPMAPIAAPAAPHSEGSGAAFQSVFTDALAKVEAFQRNATASVDRFLAGEGEELHQVALNAQQAELAFELFLQVRNKVVSAYQEVMRMQV
jgi:flagellar hook-basal body complex protein FliE